MKDSTKRSLNLSIFESVVTAGLLAMPIMTLFYYEIGMNNEQVALSQSIFTIVMIVLDLPMGWIADRFSRKWANVIGDFGVAIGLLLYSTVNSFSGVVFSECILAVFGALSAGVDISLIRHFANKLDKSQSLFKSKAANVIALQNVLSMFLMILGGPIGAIDFRLAIALSSVVYFLGGIASLFIIDDSEKLVPTHKNPVKDLGRVVVESAKNPKLRLRIFVQAFGREATHSTIWFFTPILIFAGVPKNLVSIGWVFNCISCVIGAKLAGKFAKNMSDWKIFTIPIALVFVSMSALSIKISMVTIPFYLLMGVVQGWAGATLRPMTQQHAKASEQTSVSSVASTVGRIIYAVAGWLVGMAADVDLRYAALTNLILFVPIGIILTIKLKRER